MNGADAGSFSSSSTTAPSHPSSSSAVTVASSFVVLVDGWMDHPKSNYLIVIEHSAWKPRCMNQTSCVCPDVDVSVPFMESHVCVRAAGLTKKEEEVGDGRE